MTTLPMRESDTTTTAQYTTTTPHHDKWYYKPANCDLSPEVQAKYKGIDDTLPMRESASATT